MVNHGSPDDRRRRIALPREDGWCILRTNGRRTLRLAESLNDAGIEAWTPMAVRERKLSRIHMGVRQVDHPMMPSFVFARARHLTDLLAIVASPTSQHPDFTIFLHAGRAPVISDGELEKLRAAERRSKNQRRKDQRYKIDIGFEVRPTEGPFAGMVGVVEEVRGKSATVNFGGTFRFNIASWLLAEDHVDAA